ncbi:MAG TPA: hypothetical protein VNA12_05495, partial [Mycobacteriales bacterium]|nr:hypothetical protein [Mycobacteriales bacterium]
MRDDDLRALLARVDPSPPAGSAERAREARAHELLEAIMATPVDTTPENLSRMETRRGRRWLLPAVAASAVGALAVGVVQMTGGGDEPAKPAVAAKRLELKAPDGSQMASCLMFDEKFLADMSPAFAGTVRDVDADSVVIDVDRWYSPKNSDVTEVELTTGTAGSVALDGVEFQQGQRYL